MSQENYQQLIERVLQNVANPTISTDVGVEAAQQVGKLANQEEINWALAGGLAMHLYGSPRLTKDVDVIASQHLSLVAEHQLTFGGSSYTIQIGKYMVQVDWIVRNDGYEKYYRAALKDAIELPNGLRVVIPEWLVILKLNAGRQKDFDDIVFLLTQKNLVDRPKVKQKVIELTNEDVWLAMLPNFRRLCDIADGNSREPSKYYDRD
ncbi:MAG: hypothetical protein JNM06_23080 [Blastocatellia bacterium]|nr:hypothetical protein [Blastocatellia bacterium]